MTTSHDVARYLIDLARNEEEPDVLTPMRVQKLVYYAQGWALAVLGQPLFDDCIEAGVRGPVARNLHQRLKDFGDQPILPERVGDPENLSALHKEFIRSVWEAYKCYSAVGLWQATQLEKPWLEARADEAANANGAVEITQGTIQAFFAEKMKQRKIPGLDAARAYEAAVATEQGKGSSHDEVFARLRNRACLTP